MASKTYTLIYLQTTTFPKIVVFLTSEHLNIHRVSFNGIWQIVWMIYDLKILHMLELVWQKVKRNPQFSLQDL